MENNHFNRRQYSVQSQLRIKVGWLVFGKYKKYSKNKDIPMNLKKQVFKNVFYQPLHMDVKPGHIAKVFFFFNGNLPQKIERRGYFQQWIDTA